MNHPSDLTDQELYDLHQAITQEQNRRFEASIATEQTERSIRAYRGTFEREQGSPWEPPMRPVDAYMEGEEVSHGDDLWVSTTDFNYLEPGVGAAWSQQ